MTCPVCAKPVSDQRYAPFCCKRCADVDLHKWLSGHYAIAGEPAGGEDETGPDSESR